MWSCLSSLGVRFFVVLYTAVSGFLYCLILFHALNLATPRFCCFFSIYANITYGLEDDEFTEADVHEAARQAFAHDFIVEFAGTAGHTSHTIQHWGIGGVGRTRCEAAVGGAWGSERWRLLV